MIDAEDNDLDTQMQLQHVFRDSEFAWSSVLEVINFVSFGKYEGLFRGIEIALGNMKMRL